MQMRRRHEQGEGQALELQCGSACARDWANAEPVEERGNAREARWWPRSDPIWNESLGEGLEAVAIVEGGLGVLRTVVVPRWTEKRGEKEERIESVRRKGMGGETRMRDMLRSYLRDRHWFVWGEMTLSRPRERARGIVVYS